MPWCPKCKTEYREGFKECADCSEILVEHLILNENNEDEIQECEWVLLFQTNNENEAEVIDSLLKSSGIPTLRKDRGAGGYLKIYMGMTTMGIDIYVPELYLKEAQPLIIPDKVNLHDSNITILNNKHTNDNNISVSNFNTNHIKNTRKNRVWIIIIFMILPGLIFMIINILTELM
ncbi:MAG: DUF2007 domain-containing protein [Clostridia bacterium]|nr:DUF2007 domain-containing protein [Clostridia bacterium]MDD4048384.1 DUF2007 domain-containing protein [Clostridia bacterium]